MIQDMQLPKETTAKLTIHAKKADIKLTMKHKTLNSLKTSALNFEETLEQSNDNEELKERSYDVIQRSRTTLDYAMNHLKEKAFPENEKTNIHFPYIQDTTEQVEKKFEEMGFQGISQKFPEYRFLKVLVALEIGITPKCDSLNVGGPKARPNKMPEMRAK